MSGLEVAAAVIGITDVTLRSIKGLYDFFQDLQDAQEQLPQIWSEISYLQQNLSSLEFLSKADGDTLREVKTTGITQGMNECGSVCDKFNRQLTRWTSKGVDSFAGRLKFKLHSAQIEKTRTRLWATSRRLDMTVGILTLKLVDKSEAKRATDMSDLRQAIENWKLQAEQEQERIVASLETSDDSEDSGVIDELDEEERALKDFVQHIDQTAQQLQAVKLSQSITGVYADDESTARLGMPASVVGQVAQQTISDITATKKSKIVAGIWDNDVQL